MFSGRKSQERESLLSGGVAVLRGEGRAATSAGEVGREGARRRGAEKWRARARAIASARSGVGRDARYGTRLASRGERARRARGAGGDGRQRTTATRTGETRASRTVTEPRTTMRPPTERCCAASAGVGATPPRTWRTATLLKLDARRRNMATRRLSRQSAAVGARESGPPKGGRLPYWHVSAGRRIRSFRCDVRAEWARIRGGNSLSLDGFEMARSKRQRRKSPFDFCLSNIWTMSTRTDHRRATGRRWRLSPSESHPRARTFAPRPGSRSSARRDDETSRASPR